MHYVKSLEYYLVTEKNKVLIYAVSETWKYAKWDYWFETYILF